MCTSRSRRHRRRPRIQLASDSSRRRSPTTPTARCRSSSTRKLHRPPPQTARSSRRVNTSTTPCHPATVRPRRQSELPVDLGTGLCGNGAGRVQHPGGTYSLRATGRGRQSRGVQQAVPRRRRAERRGTSAHDAVRGNPSRTQPARGTAGTGADAHHRRRRRPRASPRTATGLWSMTLHNAGPAPVATNDVPTTGRQAARCHPRPSPRRWSTAPGVSRGVTLRDAAVQTFSEPAPAGKTWPVDVFAATRSCTDFTKPPAPGSYTLVALVDLNGSTYSSSPVPVTVDASGALAPFHRRASEAERHVPVRTHEPLHAAPADHDHVARREAGADPARQPDHAAGRSHARRRRLHRSRARRLRAGRIDALVGRRSWSRPVRDDPRGSGHGQALDGNAAVDRAPPIGLTRPSCLHAAVAHGPVVYPADRAWSPTAGGKPPQVLVARRASRRGSPRQGPTADVYIDAVPASSTYHDIRDRMFTRFACATSGASAPRLWSSPIGACRSCGRARNQVARRC